MQDKIKNRGTTAVWLFVIWLKTINNIVCPWRGVHSIVMSVSVCLFVCSPHHMARLYQLFVHAASGRGSVLLWQCCSALCTSGFVDDVMYSHNGPIAVTEHDKHNSWDSNQTLLNVRDWKYSLWVAQWRQSLLSTILSCALYWFDSVGWQVWLQAEHLVN